MVPRLAYGPRRRRGGPQMSSEPELRLVHSRDPEDVATLLRAVARGDSASFARLYDVLSASVYGIARRVVRDPSRAEDVTQEVFLEVWRKAPRLREGRGSAATPDTAIPAP